MSAEDFIHVGSTVRTPDPAAQLYRRHLVFKQALWPCQIEWSKELVSVLSGQHRSLMAMFEHTGRADSVWYNARQHRTEEGRVIWQGACNDFSPMLMERLLKQGMPRGALRFAQGWHGDEPHLMLLIATTKGTMVDCVNVGLVELTSPRLRTHRITHAEHGATWTLTTRPPSLAELFKKAKSA